MSCAGIKVDGGMVANNWLTQFMADVNQTVIDRPVVTETTALGVAMLAMLQDGQFASLEDMSQMWQLERRFTPAMDEAQASMLCEGWHKAVQRTLLD